jgi:DNA-binding beta-propeller fold protein YncE
MEEQRGQKRSFEQLNESRENVVKVEVTTGEGVTLKLELPPDATVLLVKQGVEREHGISPRDARVFVHDESHEEELLDEETVGSLRREGYEVVLMSLLVEKADAQMVVPQLAPHADIMLGSNCTSESDQKISGPRGVAFVPLKPNWLVTSESGHCRIKITDVQTGTVICQFGERGEGKDQLRNPWGVAVTSDSSYVVVADNFNNRLQVLRLIFSEERSSAKLEFVRYLGNGKGNAEGQLLYPSGLALLRADKHDKRGRETVLVTDYGNHRVCQFSLEGPFIRIFAGKGVTGKGDGELDSPSGITVLASSGEVAVADRSNHRVQIFDGEGVYMREFGGESADADGKFQRPVGLTSDAHGNLLLTDYTNRLQVFSPEGKHLCTRKDLGITAWWPVTIAWSAESGLAIPSAPRDSEHNVLIWRTA